MNWFTRVLQREYSERARVFALVVGQIIFLIAFPAFIIWGASYIDRWFHLLRFVFLPANAIIALLLVVPGLLLVEWTVWLQLSVGKGSPIPVVAPRRLIVEGPYRYSRNPMASGATMVYLGVAVWSGSLSALALASIYPTFIVIYTKLIEERELEKRFGSEYLAYRARTPFLIPRLWQRD